MSTLVTLQRLYDEASHILPSQCTQDLTDFTTLANRAAERLILKGAVPGMLREIELPFDADRRITLATDEYYHVMSFGYCDRPWRIVALTDKYLSEGVGRDAFIDYGYNPTDDTQRLYEAPQDLKEDLTGETCTALVKVKYVPVSNLTDKFPISAIGGLKLAMVAMYYEDQGDQATAESYWTMAVRELEESSRQFRGPVAPSIQFFDPMETDTTQHMY